MNGYRQALRIISSLCDFSINDRADVNPITQILAMEEDDKLQVLRRHDDGEEIAVTIKGEYVVYWAKSQRS